jgi:hypothetical protein
VRESASWSNRYEDNPEILLTFEKAKEDSRPLLSSSREREHEDKQSILRRSMSSASLRTSNLKKGSLDEMI